MATDIIFSFFLEKTKTEPYRFSWAQKKERKKIAETKIRTHELIHDLENSALDRSTTVGRRQGTFIDLELLQDNNRLNSDWIELEIFHRA